MKGLSKKSERLARPLEIRLVLRQEVHSDKHLMKLKGKADKYDVKTQHSM